MNPYEDKRFKPLIQIASNEGYKVFFLHDVDFQNTITHFVQKRIIIGLKGVSLDLVKYLLAHELGHILNPKRFANLYFKSKTIEVYAWKTAFRLLPVTIKALEYAQNCLNSYVW